MPSTHLRPEHLGEPLISAILQSLADNSRLSAVPCYSPSNGQSETFAEFLARKGVTLPVKLYDNVGLAPVEHAGTSVLFDGLSRVDCLITDDARGIAIEVKLGKSRMAAGEFSNRFFTSCDWSNHVPPRIKENMIAILDGRFTQLDLVNTTLVAEVSDSISCQIDPEWIILIRREVWNKWRSSPPQFNRPCRTIVFEELVPAVGGSVEFNCIVADLVGDEFAQAWDLV